MQTIPKVLISLVFIVYPVIVYFGLQHFEIKYLGLLLLALLLLRFVVQRKNATYSVLNSPWFYILLSLLLIGGVVFENSKLFTFYPVLVSTLLFSVFSASLFKSPTVIERLALSMGQTASLQLTQYTRKVTIVWCVFFLINGGIALYTSLLGNMEIWMLYNGFISYCLMGLLFAGEWLLRPKADTNSDGATNE